VTASAVGGATNSAKNRDASAGIGALPVSQFSTFSAE
jgi:hypothetical protein